MKKFLSIIVIGVIGYFGYNYYTDNKVEETPLQSTPETVVDTITPIVNDTIKQTHE